MRLLTRNFSIEELTVSDAAQRGNIVEQFNPPQEIVANLSLLCTHVLQPLRDYIRSSITVNSGYRCEKVNKKIGGAKTSQHMEGKAADLKYMQDGRWQNKLLFDAIVKNKLPFDQLIWEFGDDNDPAWVHVSYNGPNGRREILKATKTGTKTVYAPFRPEWLFPKEEAK